MHIKNVLGRRGAAVIVTLLLAIGLSSCGFANTSSTPPADPYTNALYNALNYDRALNGLPPLTWGPKLSNTAGTWADQMKRVGSLYHQNLGALINSADYWGYRTMGENIIVAPAGTSAAGLEAAWMNSAPHRANILSRSFNVVGIGYVRGLDGRVWAVQEFGGI
jgi:uncharacterized protein YkwD